MFKPSELVAMETATLEFLLGLAERTPEDAEAVKAAGLIRTVLAARAQAELDKAREKAQRTVLMGEWVVTLVPRKYESGYAREYDRNARVYVSIDGLEKTFPELAASEKALPAPLDRGEDKENDRAYDKHNRLVAKLVKQVGMEAVLGLIETKKLDRVGQELTFKFSRTAGCSCPCSPGLVLNSLLFMAADSKRCDIYVSRYDAKA